MLKSIAILLSILVGVAILYGLQIDILPVARLVAFVRAIGVTL